MIRVDMTPWYYVRALLVISVIGWCVQLVGLIVEITMNERALVTAPGNPPWSRTGQWYGWEHGATTSKHYAHMMPMRGHFFYTDGWGPQGQQEIWSTISFGYHREADAWWSEAHGPEPRTGIAGDGPNTWSPLRLIYQRQPPRSPPIEDLSGSLAKTLAKSRRLQLVEPVAVRAVVPSAVQWPALLEPTVLSCGSSRVIAISGTGLAAVVLDGHVDGIAAHTLDGFQKYGRVNAATFGKDSIYVLMTSGRIMRCPSSLVGESTHCELMDLPHLPPSESGSLPAAVVFETPTGLHAAAASGDGGISIMELAQDPETWAACWQLAAFVLLPTTAAKQQLPEIVSLSASPSGLLALAADGVLFHWPLNEAGLVSDAGVSLEVPSDASATARSRTWLGACTLPDQKIVRLANILHGSSRGL